MALHWRPVGPEPVGTYWRRRAGLVVGVVLAVFLVSLLTGGDEPDRLAGAGAVSSPEPSARATSGAQRQSPAPSADPADPGGCAATALEVTATSDKGSYPIGGRPVLELRVMNTGDTPCTVNLGQGGVELLVFSGPDRIWSSDDCASGGAAKPTTLPPGGPASTRLTWAGRRSLPGCEGPKAQAEAGTYRVTGRVGEQQAKGAAFVIKG